MSFIANPAFDQIGNGLDQCGVVAKRTELGCIVATVGDHPSEVLDKFIATELSASERVRSRDEIDTVVASEGCMLRDGRQSVLDLITTFVFTHVWGTYGTIAARTLCAPAIFGNGEG